MSTLLLNGPHNENMTLKQEIIKYLKCILGIQLGNITSENVWRPHNCQIFRRHACSFTLKRHSIEMTHQPVHCPETHFSLSLWIYWKIQDLSRCLGKSRIIRCTNTNSSNYRQFTNIMIIIIIAQWECGRPNVDIEGKVTGNTCCL